MAIPTTREIRLPLLRFAAAQGGSGDVRLADAVQYLAKKLELTKEERERRGWKNNNKIFYQLVAFSRQDLVAAGLIERNEAKVFIITEVGKRFEKISKTGNYPDLESLPGFREHRRQKREKRRQKEEQQQASSPDSQVDGEEDGVDVSSSPDDKIQQAHDELKGLIQSQLKDQIFDKKKMDYAKFEKMVLRVLEKMGYGEGEHTGGRGDGGIDGIMSTDRLGLRRVFVQVKYYQPKENGDDPNTIGPGAIREFAGSLAQKSADAQGIFITSSTFSPAARKAAKASAHHIVLIDIDRLRELMIEHEVGIRVKETYSTYDIDKNFWTLDDD